MNLPANREQGDVLRVDAASSGASFRVDDSPRCVGTRSGRHTIFPEPIASRLPGALSTARSTNP